MKIIKKEILEFSEKEIDAIQLVTEICTGLMREANDPQLERIGRRNLQLYYYFMGV